jgi:hypothetical protein
MVLSFGILKTKNQFDFDYEHYLSVNAKENIKKCEF